MPYKWIGTGTLTRVGGNNINPGEVFDPTDAELKSFAGAIEEVEDSSQSDEEDAQTPDESAEDTPLEDKEYSDLRQMAMDADTDEINGRSSKEDIIAYFED